MPKKSINRKMNPLPEIKTGASAIYAITPYNSKTRGKNDLISKTKIGWTSNIHSRIAHYEENFIYGVFILLNK